MLLRLTCNGGVLGHLVGQGVDESLLQVGEEHLVSPVHQFCGQPVLSIQGFQNINFQYKSIPLRLFNVLNVLNGHVKATGRRLTPPSSTCSEDRYPGNNQLNEEITPLLPTAIGERFSQTI